MLDRGMVHILVTGDIVDHYCFMFDRGVGHIVVAGYIVPNYCLRFDKRSGSYCCGWFYC